MQKIGRVNRRWQSRSFIIRNTHSPTPPRFFSRSRWLRPPTEVLKTRLHRPQLPRTACPAPFVRPASQQPLPLDFSLNRARSPQSLFQRLDGIQFGHACGVSIAGRCHCSHRCDIGVFGSHHRVFCVQYPKWFGRLSVHFDLGGIHNGHVRLFGASVLVANVESPCQYRSADIEFRGRPGVRLHGS